MKLWLVIGILLVTSKFTLAQDKYNANWVFGDKAGINFSDTANPFTYVTNSNDLWTTGTFSDSNGNLLFYIAPDTVSSPYTLHYPYAIYNADDGIIANSDSLNMSYTSNGAIFLPEQNCVLFYVNQVVDSLDGQLVYESFLYCTIMTKDSNGYQVIRKNKRVFNSVIEEKIAVVKHANGKDWWLVVHKSNL